MFYTKGTHEAIDAMHFGVNNTFFFSRKLISDLPLLCLVASQIGGQPHDDMLRVPVPPQTKVPLYGDHISSRKAQAMKQAKDRKKQLAKLGPASNLAPLSIDKLDPHFVSDVEITKMHTKVNKIRKKKTLTKICWFFCKILNNFLFLVFFL